MKKAVIVGLITMVFPVLLIGICFAGFGGGEVGSISSPLMVFASEEQAYRYQYIGTELGVPWDIAILADGLHAQSLGLSDMEEYNPLLTSLQFCILLEDEMVPVVPEAPEGEEEAQAAEETEAAGESEGETEEAEGTEAEEGAAEEPVEEIEWVSQGVRYYTGQEEILEYAGLSIDELTYRDVNGMMEALNAIATEKSTDEIKYEVTLIANPDYEGVLRDFIGLDEENIQNVMELYSSNYMAAMYGYSYHFPDIVLPDIVQGEVTRQELALVAISLINHPYLMGGKSSQTGPPAGPLDCSGFVDWVYVQCFGVGASSGKVPEGVAVAGTAQQWYASEEITADELKVGDLGFLYDPAAMSSGKVNHVGIYIGTYNNKTYWIHCGGRYYGTPDAPKGRVGISTTTGSNSYNPVDGTSFSPSMHGCNFRFFRRPRFEFLGE